MQTNSKIATNKANKSKIEIPFSFFLIFLHFSTNPVIKVNRKKKCAESLKLHDFIMFMYLHSQLSYCTGSEAKRFCVIYINMFTKLYVCKMEEFPSN